MTLVHYSTDVMALVAGTLALLLLVVAALDLCGGEVGESLARTALALQAVK